MKILLNIDEVLSIAIQMESNAIDFYRKAASLQANRKVVAFLQNLAIMEDGHRAIFMNLRSKTSVLPGKSREELDPEGGLFLSAITAGYHVEGSIIATNSLTGDESLGTLLTTGIELEKQSVLFYLGLQDLFPSRRQGQILQNIIKEEKGHITALAEKLSKLDSGEQTAG
ncbi:MAG: ferritin family protein [Kiritimatiellae bacterium]|nr:ferritin family protein [Kiritimatiellia bacterium]MDD5522527.1 ferritin family protein [Kiritimatiellia bacterium]